MHEAFYSAIFASKHLLQNICDFTSFSQHFRRYPKLQQNSNKNLKLPYPNATANCFHSMFMQTFITTTIRWLELRVISATLIIVSLKIMCSAGRNYNGLPVYYYFFKTLVFKMFFSACNYCNCLSHVSREANVKPHSVTISFIIFPAHLTYESVLLFSKSGMSDNTFYLVALESRYYTSDIVAFIVCQTIKKGTNLWLP